MTEIYCNSYQNQSKEKLYKYGVSTYNECIKTSLKKYNTKPEVIEKRKKYQLEKYNTKIQDPEYKEYLKKRARDYYYNITKPKKEKLKHLENENINLTEF
jgi:hypothetical protein